MSGVRLQRTQSFGEPPGIQYKSQLIRVNRLASLTKVVTSIAALQLIEQNKLQLDQEVASILPELANLKIVDEQGQTSDSKTPITLKMLLTHTSGLS